MSFDPEGYDTRQERLDKAATTFRLVCTIVVLLIAIGGVLIERSFR